MEKLDKLLAIMEKLRDPETGCPWDRAQSFKTIAPYTIEETYEVVDAIERESMDELKAELGDLLFQIVFYSQIAKEQDLFNFDNVVMHITEKIQQRHPHVFGDLKVDSIEEQSLIWDKIKHEERQRNNSDIESILHDIPVTMPALTRALKLHKTVAKVGFDWPDINGVMDKLHEEIGEVEEEISNGQVYDRMLDEIGDLLFVTTILARHAKVDPETALRHANRKFERRFQRVEALLREENININEAGLEKMDALWDVAKREEKSM